ncbi:unnamed protein product [Mytilus coruscus]|uniref:Uncharacterized protein n=1 Tax=Mytilus coruscus TaxID=42192 RepID=A0A6J8EDA8_MYTCO|nr:unnamed protein product [Mytilus coruscus]
MIIKQRGYTCNVSDLRDTSHRSFRLCEKSTNTDLLLLESRPSGLCNRCSNNYLEQHVCVCIPSNCLISKILQHMTRYDCQLILIAPHWPRRHWNTNLLEYIIDYPSSLPVSEDLLHQPKTNIFHPNPAVFNLTAWFLSTNSLKRKVFLKKLENYLKPHGALGLKKITLSNFENSIAGVVDGKLIPIVPL